MKRNAVNSSLHLRIRHDRRLWRNSTSIEVRGSCCKLLMMLPRASICIVHLVWHMVRTPILPLSHGILSLIRRHIPCLQGAYFVSVMDSCDVDITYLDGALLQHAARCQIQRMPHGHQNVMRLGSTRDSRSVIATLSPLMFTALLQHCLRNMFRSRFNRKNTFCSYRRNSPCVGLRAL